MAENVLPRRQYTKEFKVEAVRLVATTFRCDCRGFSAKRVKESLRRRNQPE